MQLKHSPGRQHWPLRGLRTESFINGLLDTFSWHRFCGQYFMLICYASFSLSDIHTSKTLSPAFFATQKILIHTDSTYFFYTIFPRVPNGVWRWLLFFFFLRMRCVIFFDTLPKGFGDSFVAPHLLPGTNCIMNPERMPVSAPSNECPRWWLSGWR